VSGTEHATEHAPAEPEAATPPSTAAPLTPGSIAWLQRNAGNAATGRALALMRATSKSVASGGQCTPARKITGVVFHPAAEKETEVAKKIVAGSTSALQRQNIELDLQIKPFVELFGTDLTTNRGEPNEERMIRTEGQLCALMAELEPLRSRAGVVVLVAPFAGEVCSGGAIACYMPNLGKHCGTLKTIKRMILVDTFAPEDELGEVLAHELGHHADWPQYRHPTEPRNYLNFGKGRDHYFPDVLQNMCSKDFQF
jgi:hypothetical protein